MYPPRYMYPGEKKALGDYGKFGKFRSPTYIQKTPDFFTFQFFPDLSHEKHAYLAKTEFLNILHLQNSGFVFSKHRFRENMPIVFSIVDFSPSGLYSSPFGRVIYFFRRLIVDLVSDGKRQ